MSKNNTVNIHTYKTLIMNLNNYTNTHSHTHTHTHTWGITMSARGMMHLNRSSPTARFKFLSSNHKTNCNPPLTKPPSTSHLVYHDQVCKHVRTCYGGGHTWCSHRYLGFCWCQTCPVPAWSPSLACTTDLSWAAGSPHDIGHLTHAHTITNIQTLFLSSVGKLLVAKEVRLGDIGVY